MPVLVAWSQYLVLGCRVVWSPVANVTGFQLLLIAVEVVRVYRMVSLGTPLSSARMDKFGLGFPPDKSRYDICTHGQVVAERVVARRERHACFANVSRKWAYNARLSIQRFALGLKPGCFRCLHAVR